MAQTLYINHDPATQARATALGCGWLPAVPPQYANIATAPCVILNGAGQTTVIPDDGSPTHQTVAAALQPILDAETAAAAAQAALQGNQATLQSRAQTALAANAAFLALPSPSQAQAVAQVQMLTKECTALVRLALGLFDSTAGT